MKKVAFFFALALFSVSTLVLSQGIEKTIPPYYRNQIGVQLNPYLNSNESLDALVYGLRYGYKLSKPITIGAEVSGSFPAFNYYIRNYNYKIGLYTRYTVLTEKRVQPFFEAASFFAHTYIPRAGNYPGKTMDQFGLYIAPGISLYTKNRKYSMDLYYKLYIHPGEMYFHENTISYKINFHF
jgi:hypothetical protein